MESYISFRKKKRFSDIQMILTFMVSFGLLVACPAKEDEDEALSSSSKYKKGLKGEFQLEKESGIPSNVMVLDFSPNFYEYTR